MLRRIHDPDRGANMVEYGAVILLVAAILAAVVGTGIDQRVSGLIEDAVGSVAGGPEEAGPSDDAPADQEPAPRPDPAPSSSAETADLTEDTPFEVRPAVDGGGGDWGADDAVFDTGNPAVVLQTVGNDGPTGLWNETQEFGEAFVDHTQDGLTTLRDDIALEYNEASEDIGGYLSDKQDTFLATWDEMDQGLNDAMAPYVEVAEERRENGDHLAANAGIFYDYWRTVGGGLVENTVNDIFDEEYYDAVEDGRDGEATAHALWNGLVGSLSPLRWSGRLDLTPGSGSFPDRPDRPDRDEDEDSDSSEDEREEDGDDGPSCTNGNSFLPGTPVLLADGTSAPIEDVAVGDAVLAFDPLTGEEGPRTVTDTIVGDGEKTLVEITVADGTGAPATITATDEHPFWDPEAARWTDAIDLTPGTVLRTSTGTWAEVTAVDTRTTADQQVHNLTVAGIHTYYVGTGADAVLVHNYNSQLQPGQCASNGRRSVPDDSHLPEASELIAEGQEWQTPPGSRRGRARNNFPMQGGPPSTAVYKRNPATGNISNYIVYDENGNAIKRVDLEGATHAGVPTPHVVYYEHNSPRPGAIYVGEQSMVRPARPDEIP
ncbi:polymorphic toxin-type HINT domain-containing protein [Nocardiopsis trehalosi]|uniref:polymorphic toxin-type HINT domain-containing protein n=1 Tax=Nocardiopsis trehalosi TaxID=109329 RepID=UPI0012F780CB|nr:polymorphic toxin-type HINT domain-containing protein [Nocardiopsis trehalosi]